MRRAAVEKKFIRFSDAVERYSLSLNTVKKYAIIAEALYDVGKCKLIDVNKFDEFLETRKCVY